MTLAPIVLGFVTLQRFGELVLANRNTRRLLAEGAVEHAPGHYPLIVSLHTAWLAGLWLLGWNRAVSWPWLGVFIVLQLLRVWVIATLGRRWTTRIIVPTEAPRIRQGPFRLIPHPNYAVVAGEIAVLPLSLELPLYALVFSALNAAVLVVRIRAEQRAWTGDGG